MRNFIRALSVVPIVTFAPRELRRPLLRRIYSEKKSMPRDDAKKSALAIAVKAGDLLRRRSLLRKANFRFKTDQGRQRYNAQTGGHLLQSRREMELLGLEPFLFRG